MRPMHRWLRIVCNQLNTVEGKRNDRAGRSIRIFLDYLAILRHSSAQFLWKKWDIESPFSLMLLLIFSYMIIYKMRLQSCPINYCRILARFLSIYVDLNIISVRARYHVSIFDMISQCVEVLIKVGLFVCLDYKQACRSLR